MGVLLQNMNETKFELRICFSLSAYEQIFVAVEIWSVWWIALKNCRIWVFFFILNEKQHLLIDRYYFAR